MPNPSRKFWYEMPMTEFQQDISDWIAVVPLAAIEQHGPHLPVGVDSLIAEGMVRHAAAALPEGSAAVFLPVQTIGKSNEHSSYPGTVTIHWKTAIEQWINIGESLAKAGIRKMVFITSHGGNNAPMDVAARELREHHEMLVALTSWGRLGKWTEIYAPADVFTDIHGGENETSVMLALNPELVNMDLAKNFESNQAGLKKSNRHLALHSSTATMSWLSEDLNPEGVVGDASIASADKGQRDIDSMVDGFLTLIDEISRTNPPKSLKDAQS